MPSPEINSIFIPAFRFRSRQAPSGIYFFIMAFLFSCTGLIAQTAMSAADASTLRTKVKEVAAKTKTVNSDFIQYKHIDFLSNDIESNGQLAFKAPDMVKWEYVKPFAYSILFKNKTLYINDAGNKSNIDVGSSKLFEQLNELITASIRGDMFDEEQFSIAYFTEEGKSLVHFLPKDDQFSEFIQAFHLRFNTKGEVDEVKMIEPSGDYTQIVFSNRSLNQPLSDADFAH